MLTHSNEEKALPRHKKGNGNIPIIGKRIASVRELDTDGKKKIRKREREKRQREKRLD